MDAILAQLGAALLHVSRVQARVLAISLTVVDAADIVADSIEELALGPDEVELALDPDLPAVRADRVLLQRVLVNLLANARRYIPAGAGLRISTSAFGEQAQIRIIDHGVGVVAGRQEEIFAPFQRLGDVDNTTGLGLGLALSKGFTEGMGGTLVPEDTPGGGLTMVVSLPVAVPASGPDGVES